MVTPDRLAALFKTYHAPLVRFLTRRLGDRDAAEEIAQETFVRALRQETIASERSWLFAVASNLVRDEARREARERKRHDLIRVREEAESSVEPEPTRGSTSGALRPSASRAAPKRRAIARLFFISR